MWKQFGPAGCVESTSWDEGSNWERQCGETWKSNICNWKERCLWHRVFCLENEYHPFEIPNSNFEINLLPYPSPDTAEAVAAYLFPTSILFRPLRLAW